MDGMRHSPAARRVDTEASSPQPPLSFVVQSSTSLQPLKVNTPPFSRHSAVVTPRPSPSQPSERKSPSQAAPRQQGRIHSQRGRMPRACRNPASGLSATGPWWLTSSASQQAAPIQGHQFHTVWCEDVATSSPTKLQRCLSRGRHRFQRRRL